MTSLQTNDMTSQVKSCRTLLLLITVILAILIVRYYIPVHLPGPMVHPLKYKIISASFALVFDLSHFIQSTLGIPYYTVLNTIVDSFDPIKIRPFDRGQVKYHDEYVENVLVRIYTPLNSSQPSLLPVVFFFHGGGFFFGSIYSHDTMTFHLSMYSGAKVIAINYQRTPNVHYPTPIDEGLRVIRHVMNHNEEFSIDPTKICLAGDSAGGNMAVVIERHLRDENRPKIRAVLLLYPLLQLVNYRLESYRRFLPYRLLSILREETLTQVANFYVNTSFSQDDLFNNRHLSHDDLDEFYSKVHLNRSKIEIDDENSLRRNSHPDTKKLFDENVSPLLADDEILRQSPSTFIVACTYDVLLSDAQIYYSRLKLLNVANIIYREYRIFHGVMTFVDFPVAFDEAFDIINDSAQFIVNLTTTSAN